MSIKALGRGIGWIIVGTLLAVNLFVGFRLYSQEAALTERDDAYAKIALFTKVMEQVRAHYVDAGKVSYSNLVYNSLRGMLGGLDPHSAFLDESGYGELKEDTSGQFGGIGIVVGMRDGFLTVIAPMEETPAFRAGILAGDRILEIDGKPLEITDQSQAMRLLRGEPETKVTIKISRPSKQETKVLNLVRKIIEVPTVKDAHIIEDGIGYIRITQFSEPTGAALQTALEALQTNNLKALVLDLRNNPGGLLDSAREVAEKFLPRQAVVVSTHGRSDDDVKTLKARGTLRLTNFPMAVLINSGSASASEIVAGALQDHKRAVLLGEKSFGKGSVQTVVQMDGGTAIRLTTAKYHTPADRVIHEKGIEPDIVVPMSPEVWRKLLAKRAQPAGAELPDDPDDSEDNLGPAGFPLRDIQLERAVDVLRGIMTFTQQNAPQDRG